VLVSAATGGRGTGAARSGDHEERAVIGSGEGVELLQAIQDVYLDTAVTLA
jgi:hypothetical protein